MAEARGDKGDHAFDYEIYGTRVSVSAPSADLLTRVTEQLPRDATPCEPGRVDRRFALDLTEEGDYALVEEAEVHGQPSPDLDGALKGLRVALFFHAMRHARDRLVMHAGAVGHEGRAIVLPGTAMLGKTRLVMALIRAGAVYYADDWTLIDRGGNAHPYPTPLYIPDQDDVSAESLGGARGDRPIPVGVIARIEFRAGARWDARRLSPADGVLMLLNHAYGMDAPDFALEAARNATTDAVVLEGTRGEAEEAAAALLELAS